MYLRPKELADRLGVTKAAVSQAVTRGRLIAEPDGSIDPDEPQNREYLRRWTLHRGKSRPGFSAGGPERAAAMLERAVAAYARRFQEYRTRRGEHFPRRYAYAWLDAVFCRIRDSLRGYPDLIDWSAQPFEIELERAVGVVIRSRDAARPEDSVLYEPPAPDTEVPLPESAEGLDLDHVRACLDSLAARRHDLERWITSGELIPRDEVGRIVGKYGGVYINAGLLRFPRRSVAMLSAVWASAGLDAAKDKLSEMIQAEVDRLDAAISMIQEEGAR